MFESGEELVKLGFYTYKIRFSEQSTENHGVTDTDSKEIWINTKGTKEMQRETLFHELLHVALEDCPALRIEEMKADDREEDIVRAISPRMMQFLCDNPSLQEFLFMEDE